MNKNAKTDISKSVQELNAKIPVDICQFSFTRVFNRYSATNQIYSALSTF